jgi:hypothetical protein
MNVTVITEPRLGAPRPQSSVIKDTTVITELRAGAPRPQASVIKNATVITELRRAEGGHAAGPRALSAPCGMLGLWTQQW